MLRSTVQTVIMENSSTDGGTSESQAGNVREHERSREQLLNFNECDMSFTQREDLDKHKGTHTTEKRFEWSQHLETRNAEKRAGIVLLPSTIERLTIENSTSGVICQNQALSVDRQGRAGESLKSNQRNNYFTKKQSQTQRDRTQTGEKSFKCKMCSKCFSDKLLLDEHEKSHAGEKRFECNECGKSFRHKGNLNQHKRTHTGVKAFKCSHCNRCFGHKGHLNEHTRIHTGEKPFQCNLCGKRFNRKGLVKQHQRTHAREKTLTCERCGQLISAQGGLQAVTSGHKCDACFRQTENLPEHKTIDVAGKSVNCDQDH